MEVIFNVKCYDENRILTEGEKELYKQIVYALYNKFEQMMDLSLLKYIIITENYKEELFEFQRQNNHEEFLTDNEYGQGWAQVVSGIDENGKLNYSVLIKKELILAIVPDNIMDELKNNLNNGEAFNEQMYYRQMAINAVHHELSHVHEFSLRENIEWIKNINGKSLHIQYLILALEIWQEYFACRNSASTFNASMYNYQEIVDTCLDIEKKLQEERENYNIGYLNLNMFIEEFHQYTNFIFKKVASMHGTLFCLAEDQRSEVISKLKVNLKETYMSKILFELGENLNMLYLNFPTWKNETEFNQLIGTIEKYYKQFEIYISEIPEGFIL